VTAAARKTSRLKFLCQRPVEYGLNEPSGSYAAEGIRFLRTTDIDDMGRLQQDTGVFLPPEKAGALRLQDGDFLISRSGTLGRSFVYSSRLHGECSFAGYLVRFRLRQAHDPRFLFYFTKSQDFAEWLKSNAIESTIGNINGQKYANMVVPFVEPNEQRAIASFLDRETARLDGLVAQKEKLLALLEEKRASLITHAVTRGLNPHVPTKPSGIPWLGHIPKHWQVAPLRWYLSLCSGDGIPSFEVSPEATEERMIPVIGGNGVNGYSRRQNITGRTLAIGRVGALCGNVHLVEPPAWITDNALMLTKIRAYDIDYLALLLRALNLNQYAAKNAQPLITGTVVRDQCAPIPPILEQRTIAAYCHSVAGKIGTLLAKLRYGNELLRERRPALISAAVTGQIDVRNWKPAA
jgi:type I restriction enzyme S subunit